MSGSKDGPYKDGPYKEFAMVRAVHELSGKRGHVAAGTKGTVLMVHGDGKAYEIEFEPHTILCVDPEALEPA
jgi:hypothetical protein